MASRKSDEDRALWAAVTATVRPLDDRPRAALGLDDHGEREEDAPSPKHRADPKRQERQALARERILRAAAEAAAQGRAAPRAGTAAPPLSAGESPGLDRRTASRLRRGKLSIDGRLDLHGMSREAAQTALMDFILAAEAAGKRCVVVVTGKGRGILKESVPHWLNLPPLRQRIIAFDTTRPEHGGDGALYVLLKRRRDRDGPEGGRR